MTNVLFSIVHINDSYDLIEFRAYGGKCDSTFSFSC